MKLISHKPKKCNVCGEKINEKNIIKTNGYIRRKCKDCIRKQSKDINRKKYKALKEWRNFK